MKYKILYVAKRPTGGVEYHRMHAPHHALGRLYPEEFDIQTIDTIIGIDDEFLKQFQLVCFSRTLAYDWRRRIAPVNDGKNPWDVLYFEAQNQLERLKNLGIVTVVDLDDTWKLHEKHLFYWNYVKDHIGVHNELCARMADRVICTTPFLRDELLQYNTKVSILSNAIDPTLEQFQPKAVPNDVVMRFGWFGSSSHTDDIAALRAPLKAVWADRQIRDKVQLVLGGFHLNDKVAKLDPKTGKTKDLFLPAEHKTFGIYENIFTDDYRCVQPYKNYHAWLKMYTQKDDPENNVMPYRRIWYRDINTYATAYNEVDVSLAPLENHFFNNCKSQLKLIEAGFMKKALICSDMFPYLFDAINGENCLTVDPAMPAQWHWNIRKLTLNPDMAEDLGAALYEHVKHKYHIDTVTRERADLYRYLIDQKNKA